MTKKKEPTFEERLARLQAIVTALESGQSPLEESVALYKEGLGHAAACREQLAKARHDIQVFSDGVCTPFADEANAGSGPAGRDGLWNALQDAADEDEPDPDALPSEDE